MAASTVPPTTLELLATPVQELIKTAGQQVPEIYQLQNKAAADDRSDVVYMDSPVIDFSLLSAHQEEEHRKLQSNLTSWGCFQLINHGLSSSLLEQIRQVEEEFFGLPLEVKQKYSRTLDSIEGYGNETFSKDQTRNWNDRLHLKVYPADQRNFKLWPQDLPMFRETLNECGKEVRRVLKGILKAIAKSLDLEEDVFVRACEGEDGIHMIARFNYYPPCSTPDLVLGLRPHSDASTLNILLQDKEVEGLQVLKDGQWFKVSIVPDALFINIGDQFEIMSNGMVKSVLHKVVIDKEKERKTLAIVCSPNPENGIGPLTELVDNERPQLYKNVENYVSMYLKYSTVGERAINAMKLLSTAKSMGCNSSFAVFINQSLMDFDANNSE